MVERNTVSGSKKETNHLPFLDKMQSQPPRIRQTVVHKEGSMFNLETKGSAKDSAKVAKMQTTLAGKRT